MEFIRRVPTDADSGKSAEFSDHGPVSVTKTLLAVASGEHPFVDVSGGRWKRCTVSTGILIPRGFRQATAKEARESKAGRQWAVGQREWIPLDVSISRPEFFIVPIEEEPAPVEKKYRPFASMKEWWPHRNRWYRDAYDTVIRGWFSASAADRDFRSGAKFLNDDGTDAEPFGVEVAE